MVRLMTYMELFFLQELSHLAPDSISVFTDFFRNFYSRVEGLVNYVFERLPYNALNRLIIALIIVFLVSLAILVPTILISKLYIEYKEKRYKRLFKKYSGLTIKFLINELEKKDFENGKLHKSKFHRRVLTDVLMAIDKADNREVSSRIKELYVDLKLNNDSKKRLKRKAWNKKIIGVRELSHMKEKSENQYILDLLKQSNEVLRIEAQIGLIKLLPYVPFAFLDSQEKPFTVWEQINVFDMIRKKRIEIPEFHLWLDHWNDSVVMFCLDMIRTLKQKEAAPKVVELVNHENDLVKGKVIKTLVALENQEAIWKLKEIYFLEELPNKLNILRSIGQLGMESEIPFLEEQLKDEEFKIKMEACKSIAKIGELGKKRLKTLEANADELLKRIINHVLDPRI